MEGGVSMSTAERRNIIYAILKNRRMITIHELISEFGVSERTIRRDIKELTLTYPVETIRGRYGGGVKLADWYHPHRTHLSPEQMKLLKKLAPSLAGKDLTVMNSIIDQFAP